ncbi:hypothetical protein LB518_05725 [Mesorhizobium sp. BR1-1-16]|jgi:hypothetical protein|uniref:hypothetical protein n=1 Tax=Mesorhizobium sp. BR1-1-16 TaxID=2876653 RepID=UPI001CC9A843|nr:hypothetical protein [Mesorhizobium sp. BR1-1-16]MBZ9935781.1 hypothetical protein [Mesorhizobium sp. BR1-1-16]
MERMPNKASVSPRNLGIGSSLAAGALMLCHMNSSGLTRYDNLIADLNRLNATPPPSRLPRRSDRPQRVHSRWVSWIYR